MLIFTGVSYMDMAMFGTRNFFLWKKGTLFCTACGKKNIWIQTLQLWNHIWPEWVRHPKSSSHTWWGSVFGFKAFSGDVWGFKHRSSQGVWRVSNDYSQPTARNHTFWGERCFSGIFWGPDTEPAGVWISSLFFFFRSWIWNCTNSLQYITKHDAFGTSQV